MTNREEARNLITDLGEEVSAASRGNTDAVARLGFLIESAVETLEGDLPHVSDVLTECLCLLQKVYQESVDSSAAALVGEVLDELSEIVDADDADSQDLHSLIEKLQQADGQPPADAEGAEAAETIQTAETPSENSVSTTINSVSARLLTLTADDTESLVELRDELCKVAAVQTVPTAAGEVLQAAGEAMDRITSGEAGDADELLQQVGSLLEKAALVVEEESQQEELSEGPETSDGPTEPEEPAEEPAADEPAAEEPQQQTPDILPADADTDLLAEFVIESLDHISGAEAALLELESTPGDDEQINIVFRAFHTIKGTSGFLGLDKMQSLAHKAENLLDRARDGEITISGGYADLSLKSCDVLRVMLEALEGIMPGEPLVIPGEYDSLLDVLSDPEGSGVSEEDAAGDKRIGEILVEQGASDSETVEKIAAQQGGEKLGSAMVKNKAAKAESVARALRTQKQARGRASGGDTTVRVSTDRLDNLINVVGELVIAHSMVAQDPTMEEAGPRMNRNVSHAGKIIRELQDLSMALRMVPMKGTFQKMARLVRDLGRKTGKSVQFVTEGDDTEIDRNMVEVLNDPLVHMIRNSMDHGIESTDDRQAAGKDPKGTVCLRAYHSAGNVVLELSDDGKGLDREKIVQKAIDRGLIESGKELTDNEAFLLIFQPGFSTAEKVTDVSGRGVGMDVVKKNIESIRGRIEVTSAPGEGSTFTLRLPLTMAITDGMLIEVGASRYVLPTVSIEQSFRPEKGTISTVAGKGEMVMYRGDLMPLVRMHSLFNIRNSKTDPYKALLIVIEGEGSRCALMVDELLGQQQVVIKALGQAIGTVPGVAGGAILGDGRVGLILDAAGILALSRGGGDARSVA